MSGNWLTSRVYSHGRLLFCIMGIPFAAIGILLFLTSAFHVKTMPLELWFSFSLVGITSIAGIFLDSAPFSLKKIHWLFILIFMVICPVFQYATGYAAWGYTIQDNAMLTANLALMLWCAAFLFAQLRFRGETRSSRGRGQTRAIGVPRRGAALPDSGGFYLMLVLASAISFVALVAMVGFDGLATRGEAFIEGSEANPVVTVLNYLLRSAPAISLCIVFLGIKAGGWIKGMRVLALVVPLAVMTLIANNPISLSRFWSAAVYIGMLLCLVPSKWLAGGKFELILIVGVVVVFPAMTVFKTYSLTEALSNGSLALGGATDIFNSVNFDAYSLLCRSFAYIEDNGISLGRQLVSVLFFFVPRSVLPIKGIPTGELIASAQGQVFVNLSCPIMAEGLVDFRWIGVAAYGFAFGLILKKADERYWRERMDGARAYTFFDLSYLLSMGFVVYLMRGALQPTFLRYMGFLLFAFMVDGGIRVWRAVTTGTMHSRFVGRAKMRGAA